MRIRNRSGQLWRHGGPLFTFPFLAWGEMCIRDRVRLLVKNKLTVTTVESCTGGMIASKIVNVAGASEVFNQGFVTYSNKAKRKMVGVGKNTLKKYGAVSEPTAREMAAGGAEEADAEALSLIHI